MPLAEKFVPSLVLHSGDQGVSPEPVEIMNVDMTDPEAFMYVKAWAIDGSEVCTEYPTNSNWYPEFFGSSGWFPENGNYSSYQGHLGGYGYNINPPDNECYNAGGSYHLIMHPDWGGQSCDTPAEWYALYQELGPQYPHTIYPHLFKNGSEYVIQYWLFYPFNAFINRHEGDWEHINVVINSQNPSDAEIIRVEYFFHHFVISRFLPNEFHIVDQTHPVVFIGGHGSLELDDGNPPWTGEGSHGSFPIFGSWIDVGPDNIPAVPSPDEFVDGNGNYIKYNEFNLHIIKNPESIDFTINPELSWTKAALLWGQLKVDSAGEDLVDYFSIILNIIDIFVDLPGDVGNVPPITPYHNQAWNDVGATPNNTTYQWYTTNPPPMQPWSPPSQDPCPRCPTQ